MLSWGHRPVPRWESRGARHSGSMGERVGSSGGRLEGCSRVGREAGAAPGVGPPARRVAVRHGSNAQAVPPGKKDDREHQDPRGRHLLVRKSATTRTPGCGRAQAVRKPFGRPTTPPSVNPPGLSGRGSGSPAWSECRGRPGRAGRFRLRPIVRLHHAGHRGPAVESARVSRNGGGSKSSHATGKAMRRNRRGMDGHCPQAMASPGGYCPLDCPSSEDLSGPSPSVQSVWRSREKSWL